MSQNKSGSELLSEPGLFGFNPLALQNAKPRTMFTDNLRIRPVLQIFLVLVIALLKLLPEMGQQHIIHNHGPDVIFPGNF